MTEDEKRILDDEAPEEAISGTVESEDAAALDGAEDTDDVSEGSDKGEEASLEDDPEDVEESLSADEEAIVKESSDERCTADETTEAEAGEDRFEDDREDEDDAEDLEEPEREPEREPEGEAEADELSEGRSKAHLSFWKRILIVIAVVAIIVAGVLCWMRMETASVMDAIRDVSQGGAVEYVYGDLDEATMIAVEGVLSYFVPIYGQTDGSSSVVTRIDVRFAWITGNRGMLMLDTDRAYTASNGEVFVSPEHVTIWLSNIDDVWLPTNIEGEL